MLLFLNNPFGNASEEDASRSRNVRGGLLGNAYVKDAPLSETSTEDVWDASDVDASRTHTSAEVAWECIREGCSPFLKTSAEDVRERIRRGCFSP